MSLLALVAIAHAACGFPGLQSTLAQVPRPPVATAPMPPGAEKGERDAFGTFPHVLASADFVAKWGDDARVDEADVQLALDALELAWATEIDVMGHPAPPTTDEWRFNVYIGDSDPLAPPSYGAAGYYYRDAEGYPYLVLAPATLSSNYAASTTAHEFYHAIQDGTRSFTYTGDDAWYWEATAMWMEGEVYPDDPDYYTFLFGYGLLPHLSVAWFDYPDTGALAEYHQYGAMILPRYVSEVLGRWDIVRDTWVRPGRSESPLDALMDGLRRAKLDPDAEFARFAARTAAWDFVASEGMRENVEGYERAFRSEAHRYAGSIAGVTEGTVEAPAETLPYGFGVNLVEWNHPAEGTFELLAEGDRTDTTEARWAFTLVRERADGAVYDDLDADGVQVTLDPADEEAWLVASVSVPDGGDEGLSTERFAWRYSVTERPPTLDTALDTALDSGSSSPEAPLACGCAHSNRAAALPGLLAAAWCATRRRRYSSSSR